MPDLISVTDAARSHLLDLLRTTDHTAILLRVNSKGCGGHSYQMDFIDPDCAGEMILLDPHHHLIVERKSLLWLMGTEIDYEQSGLQSQLVFRNPIEVGRCGCGSSFTCGTA